ncbi:hypothetical protein [Serratia sp. FGI94]|uniref:hypothetical protein n=1 Tax=Serratia sp. FGI94 TaxID=671990 RepID=UPI000F516EAB|nr:hypothetical protein [Serratia sp. FGI94]
MALPRATDACFPECFNVQNPMPPETRQNDTGVRRKGRFSAFSCAVIAARRAVERGRRLMPAFFVGPAVIPDSNSRANIVVRREKRVIVIVMLSFGRAASGLCRLGKMAAKVKMDVFCTTAVPRRNLMVQ